MKIISKLGAAAFSFGLMTYVWAGGAADPQIVLSDLHHADQVEIQMGQLAQAKGNTYAVRAYGETLVRIHTAADQQIRAIARKDNVPLLGSTGKDQSDLINVSKKSGEEFDKAFVQEMIQTHKKDISDLQNAKQNLEQPDVLALVTKLLPTYQKQLEQAEELHLIQKSQETI